MTNPVDQGQDEDRGSARSEQTKGTALQLSTLAQGLPRAGLLAAFGAVYAIGLLIVNIDLRRYEIVALDLARPEYAMAGALWLFLTALTVWIYDTQIETTKTSYGKYREPVDLWAKWRTRLRFGLSALWSLVGFPLFVVTTVVATLSPHFYNLGFWTQVLAVLGTVGCGGVFLPAIERGREIVAARQGDLSPLFRSISAYTMSQVATVFLPAIGFYAWATYPLIAREYGGGRKPVVEMTVSRLPDIDWEALGIPVSALRQAAGPVVLILETSDKYVVRHASQEELAGRAFRSEGEAVALKKDSVISVRYLKPGSELASGEGRRIGM